MAYRCPNHPNVDFDAPWCSDCGNVLTEEVSNSASSATPASSAIQLPASTAVAATETATDPKAEQKNIPYLYPQTLPK